MEIELQYKKSLKDNKVKESDLSEDARSGILALADYLKSLKRKETEGKKLNPQTLNKIKAVDKWVCYEILDFINDTDKNEDGSEIIKDIKNETEIDSEDGSKKGSNKG